MVKDRYRLVKETLVSGCTIWRIEKRYLFWWAYCDSYISEDMARTAFAGLRAGKPSKTREIMPL